MILTIGNKRILEFFHLSVSSYICVATQEEKIRHKQIETRFQKIYYKWWLLNPCDESNHSTRKKNFVKILYQYIALDSFKDKIHMKRWFQNNVPIPPISRYGRTRVVHKIIKYRSDTGVNLLIHCRDCAFPFVHELSSNFQIICCIMTS